jgi:hypothetical protein
MKQIECELDQIPSEDLVGCKAHLVLHPEVVGHITAVHIFDAGRTYTFQWYSEEGTTVKALDVNGFQVELMD